MAILGTKTPASDQRPGGAGQGTAAAFPHPGAATSLRGAMQHLYSLRPTREVFAEEAAKVLCKSAAAKAVALLIHEPRPDRMRLVASDGLEPEAIQALGGNGSRAGWDIPLRALRNRRINVIESAQTNPFVPKALVAVNPRQLTIAVVPFYHGDRPVGVAVLFAPTQRGFPDTLLQTVSQALRVCAAALCELEPAEAEAARAEDETRAQPTLLRGVATLKAELTRLTRALEEAERQRAAEAAERVTAESFLQVQREKVAALEKEIEALRGEQQRLAGVETELEQLKVELAASNAAGEAGRAEITRLQTEVSQLQEQLRVEAARSGDFEAAREDIQRRLDEALALNLEREQTIARLEERVRTFAQEGEKAAELQARLAEREAAQAQLVQELDRMRAEVMQADSHASELAAALEQLRTEHLQTQASLQASALELEAAREQNRLLTAKLAATEDGLRTLETVRADLDTVRAELQSVSTERAALQEKLERLESAAASEAREIERTLEEWTERLARAESERSRLAGEVERVRSDSERTIAQLNDRLAAGEYDRKELVRRIEELTQARAERDRLQGQIDEFTDELARARTRIDELEGRVAQLGDVNSRLIAERRELHARIESLTKGGETLEQEKQAAINAAQQRVTELESALSRMAKTLDATRASSAEELTHVRSELAAMTEARDGLREELQQARRELEVAQENLAHKEAENAALRGELERHQREQKAIHEELAAARLEIRELRNAREEGQRRIAALEEELQRLVAAHEAAAREWHATRERLTTEAAQRLAAAEASRRETEEALTLERQARAAEVSALREELAHVRAELNAQIEEMVRRHQVAEEAMQAECDRLSQALAEKEMILQSIEERLVPGIEGGEEQPSAEAGPEPDVESMLLIDRSIGEEQAATPAAAAEAAALRLPEEVLILDAVESGESTARQLMQHGYNTVAISPDGGVLRQLGQRRVACAAINLGIPGGWAAVRALRAHELEMAPSLVAYALQPGATTGFWFGPVDFTVLPVSEVVTELLQRMMPKVRRVIAMSADLDVMSDVREELNKGRISTAVVLDGRQALDLVPTVRPEAAVLHLSPTCTDVFRAIAGLRHSEFGRDIPILFLLDAQPQPREEAFLSAGVRMLSGRGNLKATELVQALAETLSPYRASP